VSFGGFGLAGRGDGELLERGVKAWVIIRVNYGWDSMESYLGPCWIW